MVGSKKLINQPADVVKEMISGLVATHSGLCELKGFNVIARADYEEFRQSGRVALISGGGSGHEPAHAGYVGEGMLSAAVLGGVFASPSPQQVYQAIRHVTGSAGALLIVKNYTGDRLNFGIAQELARADGLKVELLIVGDDMALGEKQVRRGLAGTVLVHKIAGALAASGSSLEQIVAQVQQVADSVGTMGVSLGPCTLPGAEAPGFTLDENEMELGLGIHGEPGVRKQALLPVDQVVDVILQQILQSLGREESKEQKYAVMVNGLGSTPLMELYIAARRIQETLKSKYASEAQQMMVGNYMTALEMPGMSITLLPLVEQPEWATLLEAPCSAPGWPQVSKKREHPAEVSVVDANEDEGKDTEKISSDTFLYKLIDSCAQLFVDKSAYLTELDRAAGDGDMGISMERGARAVLSELSQFPAATPDAVRRLALCLQQHTGGTSGVLYAIFLLKFASCLEECSEINSSVLQNAIQEGAAAISQLGGASEGDCTMLDALLPAARAFKGDDLAQCLQNSAAAAREGAEKTIGMVPLRGRGQYLSDRAKEHKDGGAEAIALLFEKLQLLNAQ